jgi:phage shock protein E
MVNRICVTTLLVFVLCQTGCTNNDQTAESSRPDSVDESMSSSGESLQETLPIIIDVRSKEEWDAGHLEDAIFLPHEDIADKIAGVTEDKSAKLVLY